MDKSIKVGTAQMSNTVQQIFQEKKNILKSRAFVILSGPMSIHIGAKLSTIQKTTAQQNIFLKITGKISTMEILKLLKQKKDGQAMDHPLGMLSLLLILLTIICITGIIVPMAIEFRFHIILLCLIKLQDKEQKVIGVCFLQIEHPVYLVHLEFQVILANHLQKDMCW